MSTASWILLGMAFLIAAPFVYRATKQHHGALDAGGVIGTGILDDHQGAHHTDSAAHLGGDSSSH